MKIKNNSELRVSLLLVVFVMHLPLLAQMNHTMSSDHSMITPEQIEWIDAPPSFPPGAKIALIDGDMREAGLFTVRAKLPPDYRIMPHWHQANEHVTVLSGSFYMGMNEFFDAKSAMEIPAGGFAVMNAGTRHFGFTKNEECIIQVHGVGPWTITYVNAGDDPRNKK
jgi:hypothetical protein